MKQKLMSLRGAAVTRRAAFLGLAVAAVSPTFAVAPIDMEAIGTTIAGYVPEAAQAGLVVFGAVIGLRIIIKGFKAVLN